MELSAYHESTIGSYIYVTTLGYEYDGAIYTRRPPMINCMWGLKQHTLQVNDHDDVIIMGPAVLLRKGMKNEFEPWITRPRWLVIE